ncbi:MAG: class I SAM-dependent methyltransferase [Gordonia amarae]
MADHADHSEGWNDVVSEFQVARSAIGARMVATWAVDALPDGAEIIDVGCGTGIPIAAALAAEGLTVFGIDASPRMAEEFERNLPGMPVRCEAAQDGDYFDRQFDGAVCIGMLFLLEPDNQVEALRRLAAAILPGGRLLLSAPAQPCEWRDAQTGRMSQSLGHAAYVEHLLSLDMRLTALMIDEGGNEYIDAVKNADSTVDPHIDGWEK